MDEGEVRWDGLCSRDASTRDAALENIRQAVLRRTAKNSPSKEDPSPESSEGRLSSATARDKLNEMLARLLMLSMRCPFRDVREKSESILSSVQRPPTKISEFCATVFLTILLGTSVVIIFFCLHQRWSLGLSLQGFSSAT